jgi:multisubunit Na+/H+ antiporter MnhG subunit
MARLFYEPKTIDEGNQKEKGFRAGWYRTTDNKTDTSLYLEKITKLVPTEVIVSYIAALGFLDQVPDFHTREVTKWTIFAICLIATPLYLWSVSNKGQVVLHLIISTIAFVIWAYATSGYVLLGNLYQPALSSIALILFTLVSAKVPLSR